MALKGDLASVGLADVFQMLAHNQKVGMLSIHGRQCWKALYFDRRGVTLYYNEHTFLDRLLDLLARRNYVGGDLLDSLRRQCAGDPIATVEALLSAGLVQESIFLESFRAQMEEEIYDLFLWEKVHWEFLEGEKVVDGHEGVVNENFFFAADSLIMEAARRLDEWVFIRELVSGPTEIFETVSSYAASEVVGLDEQELSILDLVDGKRNVARITEIAQLTSFQVSKSISMLAQKGFVAVLPEAKLLPNASECISGARLDDGIRLLERAVQVGAGLPDAHRMAARAYEMLDEAASATWHYKSFAAYKVEARDFDAAVEILQHVVKLIPTDLEAWERLLEALIQQASPALDPHEVGTDLTELYLELEEVERARDVLEGLLETRPGDIELKKTLITVHTKAGDTKRVMELYESIADDLVAARDPIGAVRYLQKILMIDRNRKEVSDRIKQLYVMDERHRSRRRSFTLIVASILCFGTLGTIYWYYEKTVREEFAKLDPDPFLTEQDFDGAVRMYEGFLAQYPFTLVESEVKKEIERVKGLASIEESKRDAILRERAATARKHRNDYLKVWRDYEQAINDKIDMRQALEQLEDVQRLALLAGEARDREFLAKNQVEKTIRTTRDYIAKSQDLQREVEELWSSGEAEKARERALALHRDHPFTPATKECAVPVRIETTPNGATLQVGGEIWIDSDGRPAKTPAWVRLPYASKSTIKIEREGFDPFEFQVDGKSASPRQVTLLVRPDRVFKIEGGPTTGLGLGSSASYVGLTGGRYAALDPRSGKLAWTAQLDGLDEIRGTPRVAGDLVLFSSSLGRLHSIDPRDGSARWSREVPGGIAGPSTLVDGGVVVGNEKGELVYVDARDGKSLWRFDTEAPIGLAPLWDGNKLFYANANGLLLCLDVHDAESPIWSHANVGAALATPIRFGRQLLVLARDGKLHAYEAAPPGRKIDAYDIGFESDRGWLLEGRGGKIIVIGGEGQVRRLELKSGDGRAEARPALLAERDLRTAMVAAPLHTDTAIYLFAAGEASDLHILSLDANDLSLRWDFVVVGGLAGECSILGDRLLVVGVDGHLRVLR